MTRIFHSITGFGATAALLAALVASGCGTAPRGVVMGAKPGQAQARSYVGPKWQARPMVRNLKAPLPDTAPVGLESDDEPNLDAPTEPAAPAAGGSGLRPLPKPTAIPAPKAPAGPRDATATDELLTVLQNYGYNGNRKQMVRELQSKMFSYPVNTPDTPGGWDKGTVGTSTHPETHYKWWKSTLKEEVGSYNDYLQQSLLLAQNKFDVVYYVWVSKQYDPETMMRQGKSSPFINFNENLPVVKGIAGGGWLVELSPRATILDYLKIPEQYLHDLNHLVKIPEELYF